MAPADVHRTMSNDPFAVFGAPATAEQPAAPVQTQQPGNEDPWAYMNGAGAQPSIQQPAQTENGAVQNGCVDPWANMNGQALAVPPMAVQQPPAQVQNTDQFASMNGTTPTQAPQMIAPPMPAMQQPVMPAQASVDPWNQQQTAAPQQPMMQPNQMPNMMNVMQPPQMMPPQESVPTTVVCNETDASPPSPIGDQSVVGAQAASAPEVPVFEQPTMTPIQEQPQPVMPAQQQVIPAQQPNVNPFDMIPVAQPDQPFVQMPVQQSQTSVNPFGEVDLTGQMNNLTMQNGISNQVENKETAVANEFGMPVEKQPENQGVMNGMPSGAPPVPPNEMPPPPPSAQPPVPPSEQPSNLPPQSNGMDQAPLSPADPFAVYSPVVSPGVALSPQFNDPFGYAFSPMTSPIEGQKASVALPATLPDMPLGDSINSSALADPFAQQPTQAMVPSNAANDDPFGVFGGSAPAPAVNISDPFGATIENNANAVVQSNQVVDDPFGIFGSATPAEQSPAQQPAATPAAQDPWAAAGFNEMAQSSLLSVTSDDENSEAPVELDTNGLPKQGDYYEARINASSLGAMFYTARDLENTLLYHMPTNVIDSMKSRPIVAYVAENSAAYNAGVHLGHCILSVNGTEVSNPDECADVIRNASRPMNIRGYVMPELEVTLAEGKHMVKYDKKDMCAPSSKMEWKEKYVVVGGIVSKPHVLNMYRSKAEYDIAVKETHCNYKCSVKVKQFDLRGARLILRGKDGKPDKVNYHSSIWHYITILPAKGLPIKISSESLDELEPVFAAVRRFIRKDMQTRNHGYEWK